MTFLPVEGAPVEYVPLAAALPAAATTTMPLRTKRSLACASGDSDQLLKSSPRDMLTMSAPSASAISSAATTLSLAVEPVQPKTR